MFPLQISYDSSFNLDQRVIAVTGNYTQKQAVFQIFLCSQPHSLERTPSNIHCFKVLVIHGIQTIKIFRVPCLDYTHWSQVSNQYCEETTRTEHANYHCSYRTMAVLSIFMQKFLCDRGTHVFQLYMKKRYQSNPCHFFRWNPINILQGNSAKQLR